MLDETDLTNDYDRWNFTAGPWVYGAAYPDPWYTRSTMVGLRAGAYRTQQFSGGAYAAYRTDYRDAGRRRRRDVDSRRHREVGLNCEQRIGGPFGGTDGAGGATPGVGRTAGTSCKQTSSLYLPPMHYHEAFATYQDNFLPFAPAPRPGRCGWDRLCDGRLALPAEPVHAVLGPGVRRLGRRDGRRAARRSAAGGRGMGQVRAELAAVHRLPDWTRAAAARSRVAGRVVAMGATPDRGQFFALGGGTLFRGFDLAERQGSALWVANAELRLPLVRGTWTWDALDHCVGARNVWLATFYDVGDVYANGRSVGGRGARASAPGLRVDVAMFSFIERATLRFDVGKTINDADAVPVLVRLAARVLICYTRVSPRVLAERQTGVRGRLERHGDHGTADRAIPPEGPTASRNPAGRSGAAPTCGLLPV